MMEVPSWNLMVARPPTDLHQLWPVTRQAWGKPRRRPRNRSSASCLESCKLRPREPREGQTGRIYHGMFWKRIWFFENLRSAFHVEPFICFSCRLFCWDSNSFANAYSWPMWAGLTVSANLHSSCQGLELVNEVEREVKKTEESWLKPNSEDFLEKRGDFCRFTRFLFLFDVWNIDL